MEIFFKKCDTSKYINYSFEKQTSSQNNFAQDIFDDYKVNKETFSDSIKKMHEFIEFKFFKKVMKQNRNIGSQ